MLFYQLQRLMRLLFLISVIIVTGGRGENTNLATAEVLSPSGVSIPCSVPHLPVTRVVHTQDGEVACGGEYSYTSCSTLTASGWTTSHELMEPRHYHVSWNSPDGLLLMGGSSSGWTTELLTNTSSNSSASFSLEYDTS